MPSQLHLGLPRGLFHVRILKALLLTPLWLDVLAFIHPDYVVGENRNYEVPNFEASFTAHSQSFCVKMLISGFCSKIPSACVYSLYMSPNTVRVTNSRILRWAGHGRR